MDASGFIKLLKTPFSTFFQKITEKTDTDKIIDELFSMENIQDGETIKSAVCSLITELKSSLQEYTGDTTDVESSIKAPGACLNKDVALTAEKQNGKKDIQDVVKAQQHLIQIQADNQEIERRIKAFVEKKRLEADEMNVREFCNIMKVESEEDHCARTDAAYVAGMGGKSHVRVTRVTNQYGPQTLSQPKREPTPHQTAPPGGSKPNQMDGIEERIRNMEEHLGLTCGKSHDQNVYQRLQKLENRILYLESLSPEYFHLEAPAEKKFRPDLSSNQHYSTNVQQELPDMKLSDIDQRIYMLKQSLLSKKHMMNVKLESN